MKYNRQKTQYKRKMVGFYQELDYAIEQAKKEDLSFSEFIRKCIRKYNELNS